jgi:hypothetical protein
MVFVQNGATNLGNSRFWLIRFEHAAYETSPLNIEQ